MLLTSLTLCLTLAVLTSKVQGHGYLRDPPARSSLWRDNVGAAAHAPTNYNDNALNCGGYYAQWGMNKGKCGPCGDPWQDPTPRDNEEGGKYGRGVISRNYTEGETVRMKVQITANHLGYFEFRLCPLPAPHTPVTHDCLDKHILQLADGSGTRYTVGQQVGLVEVDVRLPGGVTCQQCVVQWKYHAGNSFGTDANGHGCIGCGPQEEFYGCSDVTIGTRSGGVLPQTPAPQTQPPATYPPVTYPPVTYPPVTYPPVTYPPVTNAPVTYPPVTPRPTQRPPNVGPTGFVPINPATQGPYRPVTATYAPFTYPPVYTPRPTNAPLYTPRPTYPPVQTTKTPYQPTHKPRPPLVTSGPAQTQPPVTYPPVTYPPVTYPPVTYPPVTYPPVTYPPVTNPPVTQAPSRPVTNNPQVLNPIHVCFSIPPYTTPQLDNWCQVQCHTLGGTCPPDICFCQYTTNAPYNPITSAPITQAPYTYPPVTYPPVTNPPVTYPPVTQAPYQPTHKPRPPLVTSGPAQTQPPATVPPVTYPPVTYPPVTYPPVTNNPGTYPPGWPTYPHPLTNAPVTQAPYRPTAQPTSGPYTHRPRPPLVGSTSSPYRPTNAPASQTPYRPAITFPPLITLTQAPVATYPPYTLPPVTAAQTTLPPAVLYPNTPQPGNPLFYCYSKPPLQSINLDMWCEKSCHLPGSPCPPDVCDCRQGRAPVPGQATPRPGARTLPPVQTPPPTSPSTTPPSTASPGPVCFAVAPYTGSPKLDQWCDVQCKTLGGTCPPEYCTCRF